MMVCVGGGGSPKGPGEGPGKGVQGGGQVQGLAGHQGGRDGASGRLVERRRAEVHEQERVHQPAASGKRGFDSMASITPGRQGLGRYCPLRREAVVYNGAPVACRTSIRIVSDFGGRCSRRWSLENIEWCLEGRPCTALLHPPEESLTHR